MQLLIFRTKRQGPDIELLDGFSLRVFTDTDMRGDALILALRQERGVYVGEAAKWKGGTIYIRLWLKFDIKQILQALLIGGHVLSRCMSSMQAGVKFLYKSIYHTASCAT